MSCYYLIMGSIIAEPSIQFRSFLYFVLLLTICRSIRTVSVHLNWIASAIFSLSGVVFGMYNLGFGIDMGN